MSVVKDFIGGTLSGVTQVLIMQPFQTIKTRLVNQSLRNPDYKGITDCFRKILSSNGLKGFYQGTLSPLLGIGPQVALQFATNEFVKRAIKKLTQKNNEGALVTIEEALASGFLTGIPSSLIVTPIDLTRIQMQVKEKKYSGSLDAIKHIVKEKGVRGMYLGFYPTLIRELIALSVYFGSYEFGKDRYIYNSGSQNLPLAASFFLGGIAGAASWLFTYPVDYIKTLIQSQRIDKISYRSATQCARIKFQEEGMKTFYKGLGVTMLRSFPVNGIGFVTFELTMDCLGRTNDNSINQQ